MEIVIRRANTNTEATEITLSPSETIGLKNVITAMFTGRSYHFSDRRTVWKIARKLNELCDDFEEIDKLDIVEGIELAAFDRH